MTPYSVSRRQFLGTLAAAGPVLLSSAARGDDKKSPNDRITLGFIGVGVQNRGHLGHFLGRGEVQVVAVCDVVKERREDTKERVEKRYADALKKGEYKGCAAYNDFRELLARKDIDA